MLLWLSTFTQWNEGCNNALDNMVYKMVQILQNKHKKEQYELMTSKISH